MKRDIKARFVLTARDRRWENYITSHKIGEILYIGRHEYIDADYLERGKTIEGYIDFYHGEKVVPLLSPGMILPFYEGSIEMGYVEVVKICNQDDQEEELPLQEVRIESIGENDVYAVAKIRAYTRPYYSLSEAREVIRTVPCNIKVIDAQKFCEEMEKQGHKAFVI